MLRFTCALRNGKPPRQREVSSRMSAATKCPHDCISPYMGKEGVRTREFQTRALF